MQKLRLMHWLRVVEPLAAGVVAALLVTACGSTGTPAQPTDGGGSDAMMEGDSAVSIDGGDGGVVPPGDGGPFPLSVPKRHRIVAGNLVTCAVGSQASVTCWGESLGSVVGSHTAMSGDFRTLVIGRDNNLDIGVDPLVCGISQSGTLACAGWDGRAATSFSACIPSGTFVDVAASRATLSTDWALAAQNGRVTIGGFGTSCPTLPAPASLPPAARVVVVDRYACALDAQGAASCWWTDVTDAGSSLSVPAGDFVDIASDGTGACALDAAGHITCWGATGAVYATAEFSQLITKRVVQLASDERGNNLCALVEDGLVVCSQDFGKSIVSSFKLSAPVVEIAVGDWHFCGIKPDNTVVCAKLGCSPDCAAAIAPPAGFVAAPP
jgi:hypothetical protein